MKLSLLLGIMVLVFLDTVRYRFSEAYGVRAESSTAYFILSLSFLWTLHRGVPDWD